MAVGSRLLENFKVVVSVQGFLHLRVKVRRLNQHLYLSHFLLHRNLRLLGAALGLGLGLALMHFALVLRSQNTPVSSK